MSFGMIDTEVQYQIHEVRRQAGCGWPGQPTRDAAARTAPPPWQAVVLPDRRHRAVVLPGRRHWARLRSRIGFTLVETGLHLIASGPPARG